MPIKNAPATQLPWKTSGGCLNPHLSMTLDADAHRIDAAYIAHAANAYQKLVEALRAMLGRIDAGELAPVNAGRDVADKIAEECATSRALLADLGED